MGFVEVPSILLEQWMWDPSILKFVSSHYLTGEPLPDAYIHNLIQASDFGHAGIVQRYNFLSELSLALFSEGEIKDPTQLMRQIWARELPHTACGENNHFHASWWHVPNYGPKYYSYLWSEALALDLFEKIQKEGLLNPEAGKLYSEKILSKGGSRDPHQMLIDYLGREPSLDAFFNRIDSR